MEFIDEKTIRLGKTLNELDRFVLSFTAILNRLNIKYVVISGYIAILFGRNRASEDVDFFIEKLNIQKFRELWTEINKEFECIITESPETAYNEYLLNGNAVRFAKKGCFIPNAEIKFPKTEIDNWTLNQRITVNINNNVNNGKLFTSPIELQISFKLFLGSEKDIEDAKYLYNLFKDKLNLGLLYEFNRNLKVVEKFNTYLR